MLQNKMMSSSSRISLNTNRVSIKWNGKNRAYCNALMLVFFEEKDSKAWR